MQRSIRDAALDCKLSEELDFTAWDNYIEFQWGIAEDATVSRDHALLRSL